MIFHPGATALAIRAISYTISNLTFCQQLSKVSPELTELLVYLAVPQLNGHDWASNNTFRFQHCNDYTNETLTRGRFDNPRY